MADNVTWKFEGGQWTYRGVPASGVTPQGTPEMLAQGRAVAQLESYKSAGGYDLARAIREHVSVDTLKAAGFSENDIAAVTRGPVPRDWTKELPLAPGEVLEATNPQSQILIIKNPQTGQYRQVPYANADFWRHIKESGDQGPAPMQVTFGQGTELEKTVTLTSEEVKDFGQMSGIQQFTLLQDKGAIPSGTQYVQGETERSWLVATPSPYGLDPSSPIYKARQEISKYYDQGTGGYKVTEALIDKVPEAMLISAGITQDRIDSAKPIVSALQSLEGYRGIDPTTGKDSYKIVEFLRENPNRSDVLVTAGFDARVVQQYSDALTATKAFWTSDNKLKAYDALITGVDPNQVEFLTGQKQQDIFGSPMPIDSFKAIYFEASGAPEVLLKPRGDLTPREEQSLKTVEVQWYDKMRTAYDKAYGEGASLQASARAIPAKVGLPAVTKAIEPRLTYRAITPIDIAMTVGTVALVTMGWWGPKVISLAPKFGEVSIPTTTAPEGQVVWKGLTVANRPILGKALVGEPKWVLGARDITLPEAQSILAGYKPEMMLETKVFVNPEALAKAGFSNDEINKLTLTIKDRDLFAGAKSPYLSREALLEPTKYIDANEIDVLTEQVARYGDKIKQANYLYGSPTIKSQLAPELRSWREVHDWDIQTTMTSDEAAQFTQNTLAKLQALGGEYRISPKSATLIEKNLAGDWKHIADIHAVDESAIAAEEISKSLLDKTGAYSYGRQVAEPAITIHTDYGNIKIMRLSESGVRKADTIARVREGGFAPPERGIAHVGVPKDIADFYVVLRTFKGEQIAGEWAEAWGYTPEELIGIARTNPLETVGWNITPSKATAAERVSPSVDLQIPQSLADAASRELAPSLYAAISAPVPIRSLPASVPISSRVRMPLPAVSGAVVSPSFPSVSPSMPTTPPSLPSVPPSMPSTLPSGAAPSPAVPSAVPSLPSVPPSKPITPPSGGIPSLAVPSLPSLPADVITPPIPSEPVPPPRFATGIPEEWKATGVPRGTIEWRQGTKWVALPPPYRDEDKLYLDQPLPGTYKFATGKGSAARTLQVIGGPPEQDADIDMGWAQVHISAKGKELEMDFAGGEEAANVRWDAEREAMDALDQQSYAGMPEDGRAERIPRGPRRDEGAIGLQKVELPQFRAGKVRIYLVNGDFVRDNYNVDFTMGGHDRVYPKFIPPNQIWIDNRMAREDIRATILHELVERREMSEGVSYEEAHSDYANPAEIEARQDRDVLDELLAKERESPPNGVQPSKTYQATGRYQTAVPRAPRPKPAKTEQLIPDRYYLGHRLRPASLS